MQLLHPRPWRTTVEGVALTYDNTERNRALIRSAHRLIDDSLPYLREGTTVVSIRNAVRNTHLTKPYIVLWMSEDYPESFEFNSSFKFVFGVSTPAGSWPFMATRHPDAWPMLHSYWSERLGLEVIHTPGQLSQFVREAYKVTIPDGVYQSHRTRSRHRSILRSTTPAY